MDLCVVDWGPIASLLAALTASCTALYISNRWSRQKGSEVLASEAKEIIFLINDLSRLLKYNIESIDNQADTYKKFNSLFDDLISKVGFMYSSISNKKNKKIIMNYSLSLIVFKQKFESAYKKSGDNQDLVKETYIVFEDTYKVQKQKIHKVIVQYALYKST